MQGELWNSQRRTNGKSAELVVSFKKVRSELHEKGIQKKEAQLRRTNQSILPRFRNPTDGNEGDRTTADGFAHRCQSSEKKIKMHSTASPAVEKGDMVQDMYILKNGAKEREMQESDKKRSEASHTLRWKEKESANP